MRKFFEKMLIVVTIVICGTVNNFVGATITALPALTTTTSNSVTLAARIQNSIGAHYRLDYGVGVNTHEFNTALTPFPAVVDDTVYVTVNGLTSSTLYSYQWQIVGATSAVSLVYTFTTDPCSFSPAPYILPSGTVSVCSELTLTAYPSGAQYQWKKNGTSISGAIMQTYDVTVSASDIFTCDVTLGGCLMTTVSGTIVNIAGAIDASLGFSDTTICLGSSVDLILNVNNPAGVTYLWTPSTGLNYDNISCPTATPTSTTTYIVSMTNGLCSKDLYVTVVPVNPPHTNYAVASAVSFALYGIYQGTISSVYVFNTGETIYPNPDHNTTTYAAFTYPGNTINPGDLLIINTVSSECSESWNVSFSGSGIDQIDLDQNGEVYPNPSASDFSISLKTAETCTAVVYNNFGQIVYQKEVQENFVVEDLPAGFYTVKVFQNGEVIYLEKMLRQ